MSHTRYVSPGALCRVAGLTRPALEAIVRSGALVPAIPAEAKGIGRRYTAGQALAVSLSRHLRRSKGWSLRAAGNVLQALLAIPDELLSKSIGEGRDHLLVANGSCLPLLMPKKAIERAPELRSAKRAGVRLDVQVIDVGTAWAQLLSKLDEKRQPEAAM